MDKALVSLVAANVAFVGSHFAMSHPLRAPMVKALQEKGFSVVYTLISLATFYWVYVAYTAAPAGDQPHGAGSHHRDPSREFTFRVDGLVRRRAQ